MEMRSAWIKWARAVEHQKVLARGTREFATDASYEYVRWDNSSDWSDPLIRMHWRLKIKKSFPERWSVLIGDALTNLRAALDHSFWAAAMMHSGQPAKPTQVQFPIATKADTFAKIAKSLSPLVAQDVWTFTDALQPFHGGDRTHTAPLEILRWLSNVDKHRFVHVVGRTNIDLDMMKIRSEEPLEVVDEWRHEGQIEGDNAVLLRLKLKRPVGDRSTVDIVPTFAYFPSIQISDDPVEFRPLDSAMEVMTEAVLKVITHISDILDLPVPDSDSLEFGEEHDQISTEFSGGIFTFRDHDGTTHRMSVPADEPDQTNG